jgi:hypothetical protein
MKLALNAARGQSSFGPTCIQQQHYGNPRPTPLQLGEKPIQRARQPQMHRCWNLIKKAAVVVVDRDFSVNVITGDAGAVAWGIQE